MAWLSVERQRFHSACLAGPITQTNGVPSIADVDNKASVAIATALIGRLGTPKVVGKKPAGQTAGKKFEEECRVFLERAFTRLTHLRPGDFSVVRGDEISSFDQYAHLQELKKLSSASKELKTLLGTDYIIKPDIVISKAAEPDTRINQLEKLVDASVARKTALREANGAKRTLHASISCKLTIRSDRVQNTRSEALNLVRNRKGRLPHIVAVTAEPVPSRLAAIALGTGDMDCVYHIALPELVDVLKQQGRETLELVETMIDGQRLRDIADLPLDLVV